MQGDRSEGKGHRVSFIVDEMLGRLARNLRMLGFDAVYLPGGTWRSLSEKAAAEGRLLLTRRYDPKKARSKVALIKILYDDPDQQVVQVLRSLWIPVDPSSWLGRCLDCNTRLVQVDKDEAILRVPEHVAYAHESFVGCPCCGRLFWPGTHREHMLQAMERWVRMARSD